MPKIKRKVEMTYGEYAKYMIDKYGVSSYERELIYNNIIDAPKEYVQTFTLKPMTIEDIPRMSHGEQKVFIDIEEVITEDTVIPKLLTTFKKIYLKDDFGYQRVRIDEDFKIQLMLNKAEAHREKIETLHMVNDDGTHTLLWRDGRLVD
ncbi:MULTISPECIES: hypothetical protein [Mammaliicoccus]|uniref:hypothetical protein n=1 Tax=Mammaliicoccus TaxID=2803850 RepID=UPI0011CCC7B8|nr:MULTISPECIES: hypothetical protein [Mammaliicoccus]